MSGSLAVPRVAEAATSAAGFLVAAAALLVAGALSLRLPEPAAGE